MNIKNVSLETVCGITSRLPDNTLPEIAFAGKSNVGKSSLINALMNRKALARTSAQPGKTQTINFYNINDAMYLVDLPGYGYAKVAQEVREKWGKLIERYLHGSKQLKGYGGTVTWISDEAEFTPKNIQTRDERADLVYAVKVAVDKGSPLRLGMYAYIIAD